MNPRLQGASPPAFLIILLWAFALPARAADAAPRSSLTYLTLSGRITGITPDTAGYVDGLGLAVGDSVHYVFAVDRGAPGVSVLAPARIEVKDTVKAGVSYDYFYDSLATPTVLRISARTGARGLFGSATTGGTGPFNFNLGLTLNKPDTTLAVGFIATVPAGDSLPVKGSLFKASEILTGKLAATVLIDARLDSIGAANPGAVRPGTGPRGLEARFERGGLSFVNRTGHALVVHLADGLGRGGRAYLVVDRLLIPRAELPAGVFFLRGAGGAGLPLRAFAR